MGEVLCACFIQVCISICCGERILFFLLPLVAFVVVDDASRRRIDVLVVVLFTTHLRRCFRGCFLFFALECVFVIVFDPLENFRLFVHDAQPAAKDGKKSTSDFQLALGYSIPDERERFHVFHALSDVFVFQLSQSFVFVVLGADAFYALFE